MGSPRLLSAPRILRYAQPAVAVRAPDPAAAEAARRLAAAIRAGVPGVGVEGWRSGGVAEGWRSGGVVEHVGSTAVPGLAGKGTVDLLAVARPEDVPRAARGLLAVGFQRQTIRERFPPDRPMLQGAVDLWGRRLLVHVHLVPAGRPEIAELLGFRDALRADEALRARYEAAKRAIVARGTTVQIDYARAKGPWVEAALHNLSLR